MVVTVGVDFFGGLSARRRGGGGLRRQHVHELHVVHVIQPRGICSVDDWADGATLYAAPVDRASRELDALCVSIEARCPVRTVPHALRATGVSRLLASRPKREARWSFLDKGLPITS